MSSICGFVSFTKDRSLIRKFDGVLASPVCKPRKKSIYSSDFFSFESSYREDSAFTFLETECHIFSFIGRIYNRSGILFNKTDNIDGFSILIKEYIDSGVDGLLNVEGEWVFVVWDKKNKQLNLISSHYQIPCLYYYTSKDGFYFASDIKFLLDLDCIPKKLNDYRVSQLLLRWNENFGKTIYEGIEVLPPGHRLIVQYGEIDLQRYYVMEASKPIHYQKTDDYVAHFLELYHTSVVQRMDSARGAVGSTLSGGLDSGSVSVLAARELQKRNQPLKTYTSIPRYSVSDFKHHNRFGDESGYVAETVDLWPNIQPTFIRSKEISPLDGIFRSNSALSEPMASGLNAYWIYAIMEAACNDHIDTLLIGQQGNRVVSWAGTPSCSTDLHVLIKKLAQGDLSCSTSLFKLFIKGILTCIPSIDKRINNPDCNNIDYLKQISVIKPLFADQIGVYEDFVKYHQVSPDPKMNRIRGLKPQSSCTFQVWKNLSQFYNIWITDPTADRRLIEFCLNIPESQYCEGGKSKLLIKRAMRGLMPENVLDSKMRGLQGADIHLRLQHEISRINDLFSKMKTSEVCQRYIDFRQLEDAIKVISSSKMLYSERFKIIATKVMTGLNVGAFLLDFEKKY